MVTVVREDNLDRKGVCSYTLDVKPDSVRDKEMYDTGIQAENARLNPGSFAQQLFSRLFPHPVSKP